MDDQAIVALYWERSEEAIRQSDIKYGHYCQSIAYNITHSLEDASECRNDTWHQAWLAMPPAKPNRLSAFFGRIVRNLALDVYRKNTAKKRGGLDEVLRELDEVTEGSTPEERVMGERLVDVLNNFLEMLPLEKRRLFVGRYFLVESIKNLAKKHHLSESQVATDLFRLRAQLKDILHKEEIEL